MIRRTISVGRLKEMAVHAFFCAISRLAIRPFSGRSAARMFPPMSTITTELGVPNSSAFLPAASIILRSSTKVSSRIFLSPFLDAVPPGHVIAVRIQVRFRPVEPVIEVHVYVLRLGVHPRVGGWDRGRELAEGVVHVLGYLAEALYEFGRVPLYVRLDGSIVAERTRALRIVGAATAELHLDELVDRFSHVGVVGGTQPLEVVVYADGVWLGPRRAGRKAEPEAGYAV